MSPNGLTVHWWLKKGRKTVVCDLWTHPIGAELRVEIEGGDFIRTEAGRDTLTLAERATEWKQQFEAKGWTR